MSQPNDYLKSLYDDLNESIRQHEKQVQERAIGREKQEQEEQLRIAMAKLQDQMLKQSSWGGFASQATIVNYPYSNLGSLGKINTIKANMGPQTASARSTKTSSNTASPDLTIEQAEKIILPILKTKIVPFLWGPPGVGKSTLVKKICNDQKWKLIDLRLSLLNPVDLRGLPVINKEDQQANWFAPSFLPKEDSKEIGVLFLDEINLAPLSVQAAAYQLILDKKIGEYKFPDNWMIIAAGNRETDHANVYRLSAPLANRFVHFSIYADFKTWTDWARNKVREEVISFLVSQPALLYKMPTDSEKAFPSPRTWSFLSDLLTAYGWDTDPTISEELKHLVIGTVGEAAGRQFITFLADYDMQKITQRVEEFIKTGTIKLPAKETEKFALIRALLQAWKDGRIDDAKWKILYAKHLTEEERASIKKFTDEVEARKSSSDGQAMSDETQANGYALLVKSIDEKDRELELDGINLFQVYGGDAEITHPKSGFREIVHYSSIMSSNRIGPIARGQRDTIPAEFPIGSIVKPI